MEQLRQLGNQQTLINEGSFVRYSASEAHPGVLENKRTKEFISRDLRSRYPLAVATLFQSC